MTAKLLLIKNALQTTNYNMKKINKINKINKHIENKKTVNDFFKLYNVKKYDLHNSKIYFRYICFKYIDEINKINLPNIEKNKQKEAVLIEYRLFPHLEVIIRNTIIKLGSDWSYTIVCGNLNYNFMVNMCENISPNIKIIKTNHNNLIQSEYSDLLKTIDFWNLFIGDKILIYQEDSYIFKYNVNDFINWDYIGAPWPANHNYYGFIVNVGNGGLSIRSKQCMIDVINKIIDKNEYDKKIPEDVYFSLNMLKHNIGKIADKNSAFDFSTEQLYNENSFGGHNFWLCDINWKKRLIDNISELIK